MLRSAARILSLVLAMAFASAALAQTSAVVPTFTEETATAGVHSVYNGEWQYMVGGGVATFDCNGDGFPDMLLAGGETKAKFYLNQSKKGGELNFKEFKSGLELDHVIGAYPLDIDGDGKVDVVLLRVGGNVVMRGLGGCKFAPATKKWGFDGGDAWSTAFAATWEHGANWPTLAVGNYIDRKQETAPWGSCTENWLFRPLIINGKEQRKFAPPLPLKPSFCPLSMLFTDWNRSGTPSLRVSNDREYYVGGQEQMWHVEPAKAPSLYSEAEGWKYLRIWGMGIAAYDINFDGYPDFFLTSMADNKLQMLANSADGKPSYNDVAYAKGVTAQRPYTGGDIHPSTGWHAQFEDVNNDGLVDLFIAKGNVSKMPDFAIKDPNNLLLQGKDGKFAEVGDKAGIASFANSRGAALIDFNLDGKLDLVVVNRWQDAQIWRNTSTNLGHWVQFRLQQAGANRDAIGSWLEVRHGATVMRREITVGGGHASGRLGWVHFGIGDDTQTEVRVIWPDGVKGEWQKIDADHFFVLERDKAASVWTPK